MTFHTVVGDNINIMKTTFELNFNFYQAFKQQEYTKIWKQREAVNLKSFTLNTCKLVIRKKLFNNLNLNKKVVFIILIFSLTTVCNLLQLPLLSQFYQFMFQVIFVLFVLTTLLLGADAGIFGMVTYGLCQTGCNTAWVACVGAAGKSFFFLIPCPGCGWRGGDDLEIVL